jgi:hypothetical protein
MIEKLRDYSMDLLSEKVKKHYLLSFDVAKVFWMTTTQETKLSRQGLELNDVSNMVERYFG